MESLSAIMNVLPLLVMVLNAVLGYRLLKIKGHSQWTYLLLLISSTPLFWFIFGLTKSKEPTPTTKLWSNVALLWGIISLLLIIYNQETLQKSGSLTQTKPNEVTWTTERVSLLKSKYTNYLTQVGISSTSIEKVVDCMVEKTVDRFPNGIDLTRTTPTYYEQNRERLRRDLAKGFRCYNEMDTLHREPVDIELKEKHGQIKS